MLPDSAIHPAPRLELSLGPREYVDKAAVISVHEQSLYRALSAIFLLGGFTAVYRATSSAQKRIAKEHQAEVAAEGWIV